MHIYIESYTRVNHDDHYWLECCKKHTINDIQSCYYFQ